MLPVSPCFQPLCEAKLACPLAGGVYLPLGKKAKSDQNIIKRSLLKNKAKNIKLYVTICSYLYVNNLLFICHMCADCNVT